MPPLYLPPLYLPHLPDYLNVPGLPDYKDGQAHLVTQHSDIEVAFGAVDKYTWTEEDGAVNFIVVAFRDLVIGSRVVVCPRLWRDLLGGRFLNFMQVQKTP